MIALIKTFSIYFIYVYCRKFNAELNKLIKTVGHRACFFEKWCWTHPQQFWLYLDIFIFSLYKSLNCNKTLKMLGQWVLCINRLSLHNKFTQNVLNQLRRKRRKDIPVNKERKYFPVKKKKIYTSKKLKIYW